MVEVFAPYKQQMLQIKVLIVFSHFCLDGQLNIYHHTAD